MLSQILVQLFYTLLPLEWKWYINTFSLWNVDKKEIEEFIILANSHHPTIKFTAQISDKEINFLDTTVFKGERFNKQAILDIRTHFKPTETSGTLTSLPAIHQGLEKGLSKVKPYFFLEQTLQRNLPLNIPCTQFKTRLRARDYPKSLVERIKNNVRSQMKERHYNKERQCGKKIKSAFRNNVPPISA